MSEEIDPAVGGQQLTTRPSNTRILVILGFLTVAGTIAGLVIVSTRFGLGILTGCLLAFVNYFWMKRSLAKIFAIAEEGRKPRFVGAGYFIRYIALAGVVAFIYVFDILPIASLLVGMAGFGFAILVEGVIRIFTGFSQGTN